MYIKMKKQFLFRLWPGIFVFMLILPSCIDHRYDLTDANLDRDIVFSPGGLNAPIGSIDTIFIGEELRKFLDSNETEILTDPATGVFYVQYSGVFPVEFPEYEIPAFENIATEIVAVEIPGIPGISYPIYNVPLIPGTIVSDKHAGFHMKQPVFTQTEGLDVLINQAYFSPYEMDIKIHLYHLEFAWGSKAQLVLELDFPENFTFFDDVKYPRDPNTGKTHIERIINVTEFRDDNTYTLKEESNMFSYRYAPEGDVLLDYSVSLRVPEPEMVTLTAAPEFNMDFDISNDNVVLDHVIGVATGVESVAGTIETGDFASSFKGNVLGFANPQLYLNLQSNLQADFDMDMILVATDEMGREIGAASAGNLAFRKGTGEMKEAQFLLSPQPIAGSSGWTLFPMDRLFREMPQTMHYELNARFNDNNVKLYPEGLSISALYTLKLPFDFETLNLQISDTIRDVFSEDLYDDLLKHARGNLSIRAENVALRLGTDMRIDVTAKIVGQNYQNIGIADRTFTLYSGRENEDFAIEIQSSDLDKIKDARHLELVFKLSGTGAIIDTPYPNASFLHIQKLRLISDGGLLYEL
jgi:hypothetical protein